MKTPSHNPCATPPDIRRQSTTVVLSRRLLPTAAVALTVSAVSAWAAPEATPAPAATPPPPAANTGTPNTTTYTANTGKKKSERKFTISSKKEIGGTRSRDTDTYVAEEEVVAETNDLIEGDSRGIRFEASKATVTQRHTADVAKTPLAASIQFHDETKITTGPLRILAMNPTAKVFYKNGTADGVALETQYLRLGSPPGYLQADALRIAKNDSAAVTTLERTTLYFKEPDFFSITVDASRITLELDAPDERFAAGAKSPVITRAPAAKAPAAPPPVTAAERHEAVKDAASDAIFRIEDAVVRIAGIPIFYIPSYTQRGLEIPPIRPIVRAGNKNNVGAYLRTTTYYTGLIDKKEYPDLKIEPGLLFDAYTKAGVLVGPALDYSLRPSGTGVSHSLDGSFQAGWINDNSYRGFDNFGDPIRRHRAFLSWQHKQTLPLSGWGNRDSWFADNSDRLEFTANIHYWSDTSVLRDFRTDLFTPNQNPDNFVEIVRPSPDYYLSALLRFRPNHFQNVQQRLPEIRFDLNPRPLFDSLPIYHRFNASFTWLVERASSEVPILPAINNSDDTLVSPRFDAYYGVNAPIKIGDWFSFTPVAGVRATSYLDTIRDNQSSAHTRVLPQLGFDLHLIANGQWNYQNPFWEINGLRHLLRPLFQYRWIPAADTARDIIPPVDRFTFIPYPPPIDLSQKRYTDDLWEQQVFRIGIENVLQTRDPEYGSRDLAWLNIYQDFRDSLKTGQRNRSTLYTQLGLAPAYWLSLQVYNRLDTYSGSSNEISAFVDIHDGDRWRFWVGVQYCTDVTNTNQYYWGAEYHLNSNYTLLGSWRFDNKVDRLTEQYYALRQRLGNTWELEYHIAHRRDARRDNGFSFGVSLHLTRF